MTMRSRRQFVLDCTLVVAAAMVPPTASGLSFSEAEVSLQELSFATFAEHLNTTFLVRASQDRTVELELIEAQCIPWQTVPLELGRECPGQTFSLLFRGQPKLELPQGTYDFAHDRMGRFSMFIAPVGRPEPDEPRYEAVFNRICDGSGRSLTT